MRGCILPATRLSLCHDQLQTCGMPPINLNSQSEAAGAGRRVSERPSPADLDAGRTGGIAVLSADLEGNVTGCNEAALKIFGCTSAEVVGQTLAAFLSGDDGTVLRQLQETMLAAVLRDGQYRSPLRCQTKARKDFMAELSVTLLRDGDSAPAAMVAMLTVAEEKSNLGIVPARRATRRAKMKRRTRSRARLTE